MVTIYSVEYGLNLTTLAGEKADQKVSSSNLSAINELICQNINEKFTQKKTKRPAEKKDKDTEKDDVSERSNESPKKVEDKPEKKEKGSKVSGKHY
jgi:hypothetical protein